MGLGPGGELQYPSCLDTSHISEFPSFEEFMCYDKVCIHFLLRYTYSKGFIVYVLFHYRILSKEYIYICMYVCMYFCSTCMPACKLV